MMDKSALMRVLIPGLVIIGLGRSVALAQPMGMIVTHEFHEDEPDPDSDVEFQVNFILLEEDKDGSEVGWDIKEVQFIEFPGTVNERSWSMTSPIGSNLWWVEHANPNDPQVQEFDDSPTISGTADSDDPYEPDLEYAFASSPVAPLPGFPAASIDMEVTEEGEEDPIRSDTGTITELSLLEDE